MDIYETEGASGVILSMGGQLPNNLVRATWGSARPRLLTRWWCSGYPAEPERCACVGHLLRVHRSVPAACLHAAAAR
jgi:hypothetical protein